MNEETLIYSDKNIKITSQEFIVDSVRYMVKSIADVRMHFVRHFKYPPLTLLVVGLAGIFSGAIGLFSTFTLEELYIGEWLITANRLSILIGSIFLVLAMIWLAILHNEYVLVITTEEGQRNPISSKRKDYLTRIAMALSEAIKGNYKEQKT